MMSLQQVVFRLFLIFGLSHGGLEFNTLECSNICLREKPIYNLNTDLCQTICLQDLLEKQVKQGYHQRQLPKPMVPAVLETGWQTVRLSFNTSDLTNYSEVDYILEVKPDWDHQQKNDVLTVFPYLPKYHVTNQTTYSVEELEPNTGYQFRVIAVRSNQSSEFSGWSNLTRTTKNCSRPVCGITNIRVELTSNKPHKGMEELKSKFYWEPTTLPLSYYYQRYQYRYTFSLLSLYPSWCRDKFHAISQSKSEYFTDKENIFTNKSLATFTTEDASNPSISAHLYYDCWYEFEMWIQEGPFSKRKLIYRRWIFHIPECISVKNYEVCGCPYIGQREDKSHSVMNVIVVKSNTSSLVHLNWNDRLWRDDVKITYYLIVIYSQEKNIRILQGAKYHDAHVNVHEYNMSFTLKENGKRFIVMLSAFHSDHCVHHKREVVNFYGSDICANATCPVNNTTCQANIYTGTYDCPCDEGFAWLEHEGKCIDKEPCSRKPCGKEKTCQRTNSLGNYVCECSKGYVDVNGTCMIETLPCSKETCGTHRTCRTDSGECECSENFVDINGTCVGEAVPADSTGKKNVIIASVVPALVVGILIVVGAIIWIRYFRKKWEHRVKVDHNNCVTITNTYPH